MIRYALVCDRDHTFDSWFSNAESFDTQAKRGFVTCPQCESAHVTKALMAPAVSTSRRRAAGAAIEGAASTPAATPAPAQPVALLDERQQALRAMIRELHAKIAATSTDVGTNFPAEARRMHEGDAPHRPIHGKASLQEARELFEEGVPVMPIPSLPDAQN